MLNAVSKLLASVLVGFFLVWATYKIGSGLGYWGPFVMVIIGLVGGLSFGILKLVAEKNSKK